VGQVLAIGEEIELSETDSLLRYLRIGSFALSHQTRQRIFEPSLQDFKAQRLESKQLGNTIRERALIAVSFCVRALFLMLGCIRAEIGTGVCRLAWDFIEFFKNKWGNEER